MDSFRSSLILIRHMETDASGSPGDDNPPISKAGRQQAEKLVDTLQKYQIVKVYSSDLRRAQQTAQIIAESLNVPLALCSELRELLFAGPETLQAAEQTVTDAIDDIAVRHRGRAVVIVSHSGTIRAIARHLLQFPLGTYDVPSLANGQLLVFQKGTSGTWTSAG
jgi:2,3-bisphosphoglycerate-dependent phosphoglycerate mutase